MELEESNRIVAAILTAGLLPQTKDSFSGGAPTMMNAVTLYGQCLSWLRHQQRGQQVPGWEYH